MSVLLLTGTKVVAGGGGSIPAAGPGTNAPSWSGKTTYTAQTFGSAIPINPSVGADGETAFQGFDGYSGITYPQTRASYETTDTPWGAGTALRITFPGSRTSITALDQITPEYTYFAGEYTNASVKVSGTWVGTLTFEQSTDSGSSWNPITLTALSGTTGSSATANGLWSATTGNNTPVLLRVRASAWTSGTATVDVGHRGGQAPARWRAFSFGSTPRKLYVRWVFRTSANWTDNGNSGTKGFFFATTPENNHVVMLTWADVINQRAVLQFNVNGGNQDYPATQTSAFDEWHDAEVQIDMGTPGNSDGSIQIWVDNVLVNERLNIKLTNTGYTAGCNTVFFDSTYGGGGNPPPGNLYYDTAMVYAETAT